MADISWVMDRFVLCLGSRQPARNHLENQRKCFAVTSDFSKEPTCWSSAHQDLGAYNLCFQNPPLTLRQVWPQTSMSQVELSNPEALLGPKFQAPCASVLPSASR